MRPKKKDINVGLPMKPLIMAAALQALWRGDGQNHILMK
jgi:hypothetical protein